VKRRGALVAVCFFALGTWAIVDLARLGTDLPWRVMYDFPDFYCAGAGLDAGHSPYTYEPLRSCEHRLNVSRIFQTDPAFAVPAPQPPYDFPAFMILAKIAPGSARMLYAASIAVAVLLTALVLSRLSIAFDVALAALILSAGFVDLNAGQIVPFALLFLVLTGWMLALGRDWLAGVFAGMTVIEPHLGLSVVLSVLLFVPRARVVALVIVMLLAAVGIAVAGASGAAMYLARVLPAQAVAEIPFPYQYSLTYLLHFFGASDAFALKLGMLSFVAVLIAGLWLAPKAAAVMQRRELLAFLPAATAVTAGAYAHMVELCFAIPAALVLARWSRGPLHVLATGAVCLLAVPWIAAWSVKKLFLASVFVCAALVNRLRITTAAGLAIVGAIAAFLYLLELHPPMLPAPVLSAPYAADTLVQTEWQAFVRGLDARDPLWLVVKLPSWCALAILFAIAAAISRGPSETPQPKS
jgi:hypothetical protein